MLIAVRSHREEVRLYYYTLEEIAEMLKCYATDVRRAIVAQKNGIEKEWFDGQWMVKPGQVDKIRRIVWSY